MRVNCLLKIDKARATGNTRVSSVMREREINNHKGEKERLKAETEESTRLTYTKRFVF